jgi:hypothetical protein
MTDWTPFVTRKEFLSKDPENYELTTGRKQKDKVKYRYYWSPRFGGLWVSEK